MLSSKPGLTAVWSRLLSLQWAFLFTHHHHHLRCTPTVCTETLATKPWAAGLTGIDVSSSRGRHSRQHGIRAVGRAAAAQGARQQGRHVSGLFGMGSRGKGHEGRKDGWLQGALSAEDASFPVSTRPRAPSATPGGMSRQDSTTEDKQGSASHPLSCIGRAPEGDNCPMGTESHTPAGWLRTFSPERALSWR